MTFTTNRRFRTRGPAIMGAAVVAASLLAAPAMGAQAYTPSGGVVAELGSDPCLKGRGNCIVYPKSVQLPSGRILAAFEKSTVVAATGTADRQTMPVVKSDDFGSTWQPLAQVAAPAYSTSDPSVAKYISNWTNPYLYVLPEKVGDLAAGTVLLATVVSGDDEWYKEKKAADPNYVPDNDGDRSDLAIALYSSTDEGASWSFLDIVATGGWQGGSAGAIGRFSAKNVDRQVDPVWEPHLLARDGKLVAFYSDENDYLDYDRTTGVLTEDPDNDTANDSRGQVLAHRTWSGLKTDEWSAPVVDVAGARGDVGGGKQQIGIGRPGMTTLAPTRDGKWFMTFEQFGVGTISRYKVSDDPLRFFADGDPDGSPIDALPVDQGSGRLNGGGSPVIETLPDGRILFNSDGSGDIWVNDSGLSTGEWTQFRTPLGSGYSRTMQYVRNTGRVVVLQAVWGGATAGAIVRHADVDLGDSAGTYYQLQNVKTGQVLGTSNSSNDADRGNRDVPDVRLEAPGAASDVDTQYWHVLPKSAGTATLLNKSGGREASVWTGRATEGQRIGQWVDTSATGTWTVVRATDGSVRFRSSANSSLFLTGATTGASATLQTSASDGSQDWRLVPLPATPASLTGDTILPSLLEGPTAAPGSTITLDAAVREPVEVASHANTTGHVTAILPDGSSVPLGPVAFGADERGRLQLPSTLPAQAVVTLVVTFDSTAQVWSTFTTTAPETVTVTATPTSAAPAGAAGWFTGPVSVSLSSSAADASVQYRLDGTGEWRVPTNGTVAVTASGTSRIEYRAARDGSPIAGSEGVLEVKIDGAAPTTTAVVAPSSGTVTVGSTITATFDATDGVSGVARTEYSTDAGATWQPASARGVSFTEKGTYRVLYRSVDTAGNVETAKSVTLTVAERSTTAGVRITSADTPTAEGWYQQPVLVALTPPSGSDRVQYRVNGGAWKTATSSLTISSNGLTTIDHRLLRQNVVVVGSEAQTLVKIDRSSPAVTGTRVPGSGSGSPRNPIDVSFAATDAVSGVSTIEYRLNSGAWKQAPVDGITLDEVGDYLVSYRATDAAGNVSAVKSLAATIAPNVPAVVKSSVRSASPGGAITLSLAGFARWDDVTVAVGGVNVTTVLTDANGAARVTVRIPAGTPVGAAAVTATSSDGALRAEVGLTIKR